MGETSAANNLACPYCGALHGPKCPTVKAFEYHENGALKRVEFYAPIDWPPLSAGPIVRRSEPYAGEPIKPARFIT